MSEVRYEVVEHNGGFAYRVGDVFSETFATHHGALEAAQQAAERHQLAGSDEVIQFQDEEGKWHEEVAVAEERPHADVEDKLPDEFEARDRNGEAVAEQQVPNLDLAPVALKHDAK